MKKIVILILSIFLFGKEVYASTLEMVKTDYYFHRIGNNIDFSDVLKKYSIDGKTAYCIEPGLHEGNNYKEGNFDNLNFSDDVKEKIKLYANYGYDYTGHKTLKYRAATQSLIWKAIMGEGSNVVFSTELFGRGSIYDVKNEEEKIKTLSEEHYKTPEFDLPEKIYAGEKISLEDKNDVLNNFTISSGEEAYIRGNKLYIEPKEIKSLNIELTKKGEYKENYIVYEDNGYQTMFATGNPEEVKKDLTLNIEGGYIKVIKKDEEGNQLKGVEISLYDGNNNFLKKDLTDESGEVTFDNLIKGKYYIMETKTIDGYVTDNTKKEINLKEEDGKMQKEIIITNKKEKEKKNIILKEVPKTDISSLKYFILLILGIFSEV